MRLLRRSVLCLHARSQGSNEVKCMNFLLQGDFGTKFVEFWRYITNGETLTRHKRITDLTAKGETALPINHVSQRSTEGKFLDSKVKQMLSIS